VHARGASVPAEDQALPFLYLGRDHLHVEHELVQQVRPCEGLVRAGRCCWMGSPAACPVLRAAGELPADGAPLADALLVPALLQAISFAQSRHYQAINNNCIHFAEFMARLLTGGRAAGAVHAFDVLCGSAPQQELPMLMMLQMMLQVSWHAMCDCSRLLQEFEAHRAAAVAAGGAAAS
jgi:hypothetical protein